MNNNIIPISEKYALTIKEAIAYFNIGDNKLRELIKKYPDSDFLIMNGTRYLIKRKLFEQWLDKLNTI
jgi:excisionase family DNA binding protein